MSTNERKWVQYDFRTKEQKALSKKRQSLIKWLCQSPRSLKVSEAKLIAARKYGPSPKLYGRARIEQPGRKPENQREKEQMDYDMRHIETMMDQVRIAESAGLNSIARDKRAAYSTTIAGYLFKWGLPVKFKW